MAVDGIENTALDAVPSETLKTGDAREQKSPEQTSAEQPTPEQDSPGQKSPEEQPEQKLPEQNGGLLKADPSESEVQVTEEQIGEPATTDAAQENGKRGQDDVDASGEDGPEEEEAAEEPALKKQKTEKAEVAAPVVNGEKKRGRGRPRKAAGTTAKAQASPAAPPAVNGEKRKRGRPRKGEEKNPKPAPAAPSAGVGSRTRSQATG